MTDLLAASRAPLGIYRHSLHGGREVQPDAGYTATVIGMIVVELEDRPGTGAEVTRKLADAGVNLRIVASLGMSGERVQMGFGRATKASSGARSESEPATSRPGVRPPGSLSPSRETGPGGLPGNRACVASPAHRNRYAAAALKGTLRGLLTGPGPARRPILDSRRWG